MQYVQSIELDVANCHLYKYIYAKQGDSKSRYVKATILINGEKVTISRDMKAVFRAVKPDGNAIYNPAIVNEDGTVMVELTQQTLAVEGTVDADILITSADEEELSTVPFKIEVERSPNGDEFDSDNEFLKLIKMVRRGEEVIKKAEDAAGKIGDLSDLQTDAKDNLVDAINEAAASGGADWAQNDPTAKDYVKNRTHYMSIGQATMTVSAGQGTDLVDIVPFAPGDVVDITVNGKEMSLTAASDVLQGPSGQSRSLTYVGDSPSSIVSGAAPVYGWTVALLDGMYMAQAYGNDCTLEYMAYVYTRLPIEYSPIIVETNAGSFRDFVPVSKIKIDGSINVAKRIFIDADMDGKGNAEIEIKGELGGYSYMEYVLLSRGVYVVKYDSNTFILKHEDSVVTNMKEYLNDWRQKNVRFQSVEVDGIEYSALLHGFERGLSGTFCTVNAHLYSVVIDFGSTITSEWFDQDWKLTIKKIL